MKKQTAFLALAVLCLGLTPELAFAAEDWVKPATDLVETLRSGVVQIGAVLVGLGVVAIGVWMGVTGRGEWQRLGYVIAGGILVMAGPEAIAKLLEIAGS
jgi:type IV secretory pathway VirB2 component (pilin)